MSGHEQERAYKRGVVLGLTLAEVVLLVLFCLLLIFATFFRSSILSNSLPDGLRDESARNVVNEMEKLKRPEESWPEFWRRVYVVYKDTVEPRVAAKGQTSADVVKNVLSDMEAKRGDAPLDDFWRKVWIYYLEMNEKKKDGERQKELPQVSLEKFNELDATLIACKETARKCENALASSGHNWPPIIILREAEGFTFGVGDARMSPVFEKVLSTSVVVKILEYVQKYKVDVIEVVGHTDEQPIQSRFSNLDSLLLRFLRGETTEPLVAADNSGLGMARAATVARFLMADPRLDNYRIFPLSSAQVLDTSGQLADGRNPGDVKQRRRIEIRLRRIESSTSDSSR